MEQLVDAYHNVAASPELRELMRQRERAKHNEASALANAERKTKQKIVMHMFKKGFSVEAIVDATGLSEKEVNKILEP